MIEPTDESSWLNEDKLWLDRKKLNSTMQQFRGVERQSAA